MRKIRNYRFTAGLVVATTAVTGVAIATTDRSAAADTKMHTMTFVAHTTESLDIAENTFIGADTDKRNGKVVGYDSVTGFYDPSTDSVTVSVALALKGGIITIHFRQAGQSDTFTGRITGGTDKYKNIVGTVSGHSPNHSAELTFVTLRYYL
jgi:hypothetical protein